MPPSKRRKLSPEPEEHPTVAENEITQPELRAGSEDRDASHDPSLVAGPRSNPPESASNDTPKQTQSTTTATADRLARFAALKSRASQSAKSNLAEAKAEANRAAMDPSLLASLSRRSAIAQHNLLKADTEESEGTGAFERKRAWDYTIEESEKWDDRMAAKKHARENNAFQDYGAGAGKIY